MARIRRRVALIGGAIDVDVEALFVVDVGVDVGVSSPVTSIAVLAFAPEAALVVAVDDDDCCGCVAAPPPPRIAVVDRVSSRSMNNTGQAYCIAAFSCARRNSIVDDDDDDDDDLRRFASRRLNVSISKRAF